MWKRFILWDFQRGSWQYDVMVGLILAFMFLTPRDWFRDQARIPSAGSIVMLPPEHGAQVFFINKETLNGVAADRRIASLDESLRVKTGDRRLRVTRLEPMVNSEGELQGYMAFARR
jgi:hypothetical protein